MAFGAPFPPTLGIAGGFVSAGQGSNVSSIGGLSFGAVSPSRYLVAVVSGSFGGGGSISSVTIGGVAATIVATRQNGTIQAVIAIAAVPTGASGTVSAAGVGTGPFQVALYALYGLGSATPAATTTSAANPSLLALNTLPPGSFAIAAMESANLVGAWSGATQDNSQASATITQSVASAANQSGNITISTSGNVGATTASVAAAWHP